MLWLILQIYLVTGTIIVLVSLVFMSKEDKIDIGNSNLLDSFLYICSFLITIIIWPYVTWISYKEILKDKRNDDL